jgi:hypothetical protein
MSEMADALRNVDPFGGQLTLEQYDINNPTLDENGQIVKNNVSYNLSKDDILKFIPNPEDENGNPSGGGQYILKDGSSLGVDGNGVVHAATPGRNDYTLNEQGYYQPTGENLNWNGQTNTLTKKINGVDVAVPNIYHKGGYQNAEGKLSVDANGVPISLAPNYLDSGVGQSWVSEYAPYITAALLTAGAGTAAMGGMGAAEGLGTVGAIEGTGAVGGGTVGSTVGNTVGGTVGGSTASTLPSLAWTAPEIGGTVGTGSTFGTLNAALPAAGSVGGAGSMSAALPVGATLGTGLNGGAIGGSYLTGANGMVATNALGNAIPASSVGIDGFAPSTSSFSLKNAYDTYKTANALRGMFSGSNTGFNQTSGNGMNTVNNWNYQNQPFLSNPQQKSIYAPTGLDVSGSQANSLDVTRGGNLLANLLRR